MYHRFQLKGFPWNTSVELFNRWKAWDWWEMLG